MENKAGHRKKSSRVAIKRRKKAAEKRPDTLKIKILICSGVFLLAFAVKMIFPELQGKIKTAFLPVLSESVDYKGAISSIGEAIAGERTMSEALGEFYTRAFRTENPDDNLEAISEGQDESMTRTSVIDAEIQSLRASSKKREETVLPKAEEEEPPPEPENTEKEDEDAIFAMISAFLESQSEYSGYELPENVSYEMPEISFEYVYPAVAPISSGFGYRDHPTEGGVKFHYGIDIAAYQGTDVLAFADGMVVSAGESTILGNYVVIEHADGFKTQYDHCSAVYVNSGQAVAKDDVIAAVGGTGNVTGVHLHFEISHNGVYINPEYYLYF